MESILRGSPASPGFDDALATHEVVEAAYLSAQRRQPVDLSTLVLHREELERRIMAAPPVRRLAARLGHELEG